MGRVPPPPRAPTLLASFASTGAPLGGGSLLKEGGLLNPRLESPPPLHAGPPFGVLSIQPQLGFVILALGSALALAAPALLLMLSLRRCRNLPGALGKAQGGSPLRLDAKYVSFGWRRRGRGAGAAARALLA